MFLVIPSQSRVYQLALVNLQLLLFMNQQSQMMEMCQMLVVQVISVPGKQRRGERGATHHFEDLFVVGLKRLERTRSIL